MHRTLGIAASRGWAGFVSATLGLAQQRHSKCAMVVPGPRLMVGSIRQVTATYRSKWKHRRLVRGSRWSSFPPTPASLHPPPSSSINSPNHYLRHSLCGFFFRIHSLATTPPSSSHHQQQKWIASRR